MASTAALADLPTEMAHALCAHLTQSEVSSLSLTSKAIYRLIRPILYYCPRIETFSSLNLFNRTLTKATYLGKADHKWSSQQCIDQTKSLDIRLDPTRGSEALTAVLLSRMLQSIERRCPNVKISLGLARCKCDATPVSNFDQETFPRVKNLTLCLGKYDPEETHLRQRNTCFPNVRFWRPFFDGKAFPDLTSLEIRHFWSVEPPQSALLDLTQYRRAWSDENTYTPYHQSQGQQYSYTSLLSLDGLEKIQTIKLECVPELDGSVLKQLLGSSTSTAANLTKLELRYCNLAEGLLEQLLFHAPPNLKHFVLLCKSAALASAGWDGPSTAHLCPLLRRYAKKLPYLEFGASRICRSLFFDEEEMEALRKDGIMTCLGGPGGALPKGDKLDLCAIQRTVQQVRNKRKAAEREALTNKALGEHQVKTSSTNGPNWLFGGRQELFEAERVKRNAEKMAEEKEEQRERLISNAKTPWMRRFLVWDDLCCSGDTFQELQVAADMDEVGIVYVLANKQLDIASQHTRGKLPLKVSMRRALEENYRIKVGGI